MRLIFNPLSGQFDFVGDVGSGSFSIKKVEQDEEIEIPLNRQMLIHGDLMVHGNLMVNGEVLQIRTGEPESTFWSNVPINKTVKIRRNRVLFYGSDFMVNGTLIVHGDLMSTRRF